MAHVSREVETPKEASAVSGRTRLLHGALAIQTAQPSHFGTLAIPRWHLLALVFEAEAATVQALLKRRRHVRSRYKDKWLVSYIAQYHGKGRKNVLPLRRGAWLVQRGSDSRNHNPEPNTSPHR